MNSKISLSILATLHAFLPGQGNLHIEIIRSAVQGQLARAKAAGHRVTTHQKEKEAESCLSQDQD